MSESSLGNAAFALGLLTMAFSFIDSWRHRRMLRTYAALTRRRVVRIVTILLSASAIALLAHYFELWVGPIPVGPAVTYVGAYYLIYLFWRHWCCAILQFVNDQTELNAVGRHRVTDCKPPSHRSTP